MYTEFLGIEQDLRGRIRAYLDTLAINQLCFTYLNFIDGHKGCKVSEVADAMRMDKSSVTRALSSLGRLGYVDRQAGKTDSRAFDLYLTPAGKVIVRGVKKLTEEWENDVRAALSEEEYELLTGLLHKARERFVADRAKNAVQNVLQQKSPAFFY